MVAHDLAKQCGLDVPDAKLMNLSKVGSTFLVKRFDGKGCHRQLLRKRYDPAWLHRWRG